MLTECNSGKSDMKLTVLNRLRDKGGAGFM